MASAVATHGGVIGDTREFFVREVLRRFLPKSVTIGTGQIVDSDFGISKQIDIIISRNEYPVLTTLATSNVYLAESIIATIEIKSNLTGGPKGTLWKALENCKSVKQRNIKTNKTSVEYYLEKENKSKNDVLEVYTKLLPPTYIFGYKGYKIRLNALQKTIFSWIKKHDVPFLEMPDMIVTEGCVAIKNNGEFFDQSKLKMLSGNNCIYIARNDSETLTWLLWHLLKRLIDCLGEIYHSETGIRYISGDQYLSSKHAMGEWAFWGERSEIGSQGDIEIKLT